MRGYHRTRLGRQRYDSLETSKSPDPASLWVGRVANAYDKDPQARDGPPYQVRRGNTIAAAPQSA